MWVITTLDLTGDVLYGPKTASGWGTGISLVGAAGATGATGPKGATGATGADWRDWHRREGRQPDLQRQQRSVETTLGATGIIIWM